MSQEFKASALIKVASPSFVHTTPFIFLLIVECYKLLNQISTFKKNKARNCKTPKVKTDFN